MNTKTIKLPETKTKKEKNKLDVFLWTSTIILVVLGIVADRYYSDIVLSLRLTGWIILSCIIVFLLLKTEKGKQFWRFAKEAKMEMRKVVWPTRQETTRTTLLVAGLVLIAALLMWGIDSILLVFIGWLTGQG